MPLSTDPFSRQYWRFIDEYPDIYESDASFALWSRLLIAADMAWPASASLLIGTKAKPLQALVDAKLIKVLPGQRFRIPSMDKERENRRKAAQDAVNSRRDRRTDVDDDDYASSTDVEPTYYGRGNATSTSQPPIQPTIPTSAQPAKPTTPAKPASQPVARLSDAEQREQLDRLRDTLAAKGLLPPAKASNGHASKPAASDEQIIARCQAIVANAEEPEWKRDAAKEQLLLMGVR